MRKSPIDAPRLLQRGLQSLRRGDAAAAREAFGQLAESGSQDSTVHMGLAYACQALGDPLSAERAADAALTVAPRDLRALIFKAEALSAQGNDRAVAYYQGVLRIAEHAHDLPADWQPLVDRAREAVREYAARFETRVSQHLAQSLAGTDQRSRRFEQSLDILCGRKELFLPAPRLYHFPELPAIQFFDRAWFPWLAELEAATDDILRELIAVLRHPEDLAPYVQSDPMRPTLNRGGMIDNPDWSAFYIWRDGQLVADHAARCPRTVQALSRVPMVRTPKRSPSALFSLLRPGARIPPHHGFINTRLIAHLPLLVPPGCGFRVGNETREWEPGRAWLFDDTIEHEAWNRSDSVRAVLLFEVWRPELDASERASVNALFEAIDHARGGIPEWGI